MNREYYYNIVNGLEVKSNLLSIKEALKTPGRGSRERDALLLILDGDFSVFTGLLKDEDPKIRKNSAIILGLLGAKENLDAVYEAYISDEILYNKAAYVEAIRNLGAEKYKEGLKERFDEIKKLSLEGENKKHLADEMKQLTKIFGTGKLDFIGYDLPNELVLTTNRNYKKLTGKLLNNIPYKEIPAGITFKTEKLTDILHIRTFGEMLFVPDNITEISFDPKQAAKEVFSAGLRDYLFNRIGLRSEISEDKSYNINFRAELRSRAKDRALEADFIKAFSGELEILTKWELSNSPSDYDVIIRLIESSSGKLRVLIKFSLLRDNRFSYRKESTATTLKPFVAATLMQLAKPYLSSNSTVLDPFCGVGTLLAEREMAINAKRYYGIDILGEAIEKAGKNLRSAGILKKTDLVNKDFAEFEHAQTFDEIVTDLPFETERRSKADVERLHKLLFEKADRLLGKKAVMAVYSRNPEFVKKYHNIGEFIIAEDFEISKEDESQSHLFILKRPQ